MRQIKVTTKTNGKTYFFKQAKKIYDTLDKDDLNIELGALYNALSPRNGNGRFENKYCIIEYITIVDWI